MRVTIADVARYTGFTKGTVSRVLDKTGRYRVSDATRERVLDATKTLGYRPDARGKALASGSSRTVLLITPVPFSPYYTAMTHCLADICAASDYCLLTQSTFSAARPSAGVDAFFHDMHYAVDGVIYCDLEESLPPYLSQAENSGLPIVGIGSDLREPYDQVKINLYDASWALMRHFDDNGYQAVAFMDTRFPRSIEGTRLAAYRDYVTQHGRPEIQIPVMNHSRASGRAAIHANRGQTFDAIFCANDDLAIGAYRGLLDLGKRVPDDIGLAGCDGLEELEYLAVPLTTISQPIHDACTRAWEILSQLIDKRAERFDSIELAASVVQRQSTDRFGRLTGAEGCIPAS